MTLFYQVCLLLVQLILIAGIIHLSALGGRTLLHRVFCPGCWFAFFYVLWFFIPQFVTLFNDNFVLGYPEATGETVVQAQLYLAAFTLSVWAGILVFRGLVDPGSRFAQANVPIRYLDGWDKTLLGLFYFAGLLATIYLGVTLMGSEGFRSELVKTPTGLAATAIAFFGTYSLAVIFGHATYDRRFIVAALAMAGLGSALFFTGARGRLLWPIALAIAYNWCRSGRVRLRYVVGFALAGVLVLMLFDPLLNAMRDESERVDTEELAARMSISRLYMEKRNFDGFANFTLISGRDIVEYQPRIFLTGGRQTFMETYFPGTLEMGVGFGTTVPGMCWLAGGIWGLLGGGLAYGGILGALGLWSKRIRQEPLMWSYLFAMTWMSAIGGNFQESLDKAVAMALPGFVWILLAPRRRKKLSIDVEDPAAAADRAVVQPR